jgi:hypothetical protein
MAKDDQAIPFLPATARAALVYGLAVLRREPGKTMRQAAAQQRAFTP